jgi:hypothetical protein
MSGCRYTEQNVTLSLLDLLQGEGEPVGLAWDGSCTAKHDRSIAIGSPFCNERLRGSEGIRIHLKLDTIG